MSLVICSNQSDGDIDSTTANNINKPFSFRNGLSSTYKIPKNSQVALQSINYSLDGTLNLSTEGRSVYQYYGEDLEVVTELGDDANIRNNSTAVPIKTPLVDTWSMTNGNLNAVREYSISSLKKEMGKQIGKYMYHPNLRFKASVDSESDSSDASFTGFKINYDYYDSSDDTIPADEFAEDLSSAEVREGDIAQSWTYEEGSFITSNPNAQGTPQAAILTEMPISLHNGQFVVNFNDPNSSDKEWAVGLSRYVNEADDITGTIRPSYFTRVASGEEQPTRFIGFYDYLVCRKGATLKVYHTPCDSSIAPNKIISREMLYGNEAIEPDYNLKSNEEDFHKVMFTCKGQQIKIEMLKSDDTAVLLYQYDANYDNANQLKAVCQSNWSMYPVLYIEDPELDGGNELVVESYHGVTTFQVDSATKRRINDNWAIGDQTSGGSSWYNSVEHTQYPLELETRPWNDNSVEDRSDYLVYAHILNGANQVIDLENILITKPSDIYTPTQDANTTAFLGFVGNTPANDFTYGSGSVPHTRRIFTSISTPVLVNHKSFFVKLDNLTQNSLNALKGNRSTIIAHVPRFDGQVSTGRIYHEPDTLVYLDLNNSSELNISSFDLSLVYVNEQYADCVAGQTIICLHFRPSPN